MAQRFGRPPHGGAVKASNRQTELEGAADTAVLTRAEVAAWLKVRPRQVERLGVPCIALGRKTVRYLRSDVLTWLTQQRQSR